MGRCVVRSTVELTQTRQKDKRLVRRRTMNIMHGDTSQRVAYQPPTHAIKSGIKRNDEATERIASEKASAELHRMIRGRNFNSMDEANQFLNLVSAFRNSRIVEERLNAPHDEDPLLTRRMQNRS